MAFQMNPDYVGNLTATADYSSAMANYRFVTSTSATTFTRANTSGQDCFGVLVDNPVSGGMGRIQTAGIAKVRCSTSHAAINPGDKIRTDNAGFAKPSTTAVGFYVIGRAREAIGANTAGIISVHLTYEGAGSTSAASGS